MFDRESCPSSELIGQRVLDETPAIAGSAWLIARLSGLDAAFLPVDKDPGRVILGLHAPTNVKTAILLT
jgi:hypothetical protein